MCSLLRAAGRPFPLFMNKGKGGAMNWILWILPVPGRAQGAAVPCLGKERDPAQGEGEAAATEISRELWAAPPNLLWR